MMNCLERSMSVKMGKYARKEINALLHERIKRKEPIILGGAGCGLVAKIADAAGIDIILAYNTGPFRMDGNPSGSGYQAYGDGNKITLELGRRLIPVVKNTPIVGGIGPGDPYKDIEKLMEEMIEVGFSGITNVPTTGVYSDAYRAALENAHAGYGAEIELMEKCHKYDIFSVAYAFTQEEVRKVVAAGCDIVSPHVRGTSGGSVGIENVMSMEEACEKTQKMYEVAVAENPDVIVVCHGGPFSAPSDVQKAFDNTDVHGFIGASSIERLPVEREITKAVRAFSGLKIG